MHASEYTYHLHTAHGAPVHRPPGPSRPVQYRLAAPARHSRRPARLAFAPLVPAGRALVKGRHGLVRGPDLNLHKVRPSVGALGARGCAARASERDRKAAGSASAWGRRTVLGEGWGRTVGRVDVVPRAGAAQDVVHLFPLKGDLGRVLGVRPQTRGTPFGGGLVSEARATGGGASRRARAPGARCGGRRGRWRRRTAAAPASGRRRGWWRPPACCRTSGRTSWSRHGAPASTAATWIMTSCGPRGRGRPSDGGAGATMHMPGQVGFLRL